MYEIKYCPDLKLLGDRVYRVFDKNDNWLIDHKYGRAAFTLQQASDFLFRLALKMVMEDYLSGKTLDY